MFERYTEMAKRTIFFAKHEAARCGSAEIGTEHILLVLLMDADLTGRILEDFPSQEIRAKIGPQSSVQMDTSVLFDLSLSRESQQALALAKEESKELGSEYIGNEHILLGLLRSEDTVAAKIMQDGRLSADVVRSKLANLGSRREGAMRAAQSPQQGIVVHIRALIEGGAQQEALKLIEGVLSSDREDRHLLVRMLCPIAMSISREMGDLHSFKSYGEKLLSVLPDDVQTLYLLADYLDLQAEKVKGKQYASRCYVLCRARNDDYARKLVELLEKRFPEIKDETREI